MHISSSTSQTGTQPPEQTFTGDVIIEGYFRREDPSRVAGARVSFAAGARTPWKTNPQGQTVVVLHGAGRAGSDDGTVRRLRAGDVAWFAPGERHWEGADVDTAMTYVAIQEETPGSSVQFGDQVTDSEYEFSAAALR